MKGLCELNESFARIFYCKILLRSKRRLLMDFDEILLKVLNDDRVKSIPILYIVQIVIVMDDMGLI